MLYFLIFCLQYLSTFCIVCAVVPRITIKINALHKGHTTVSLNLPDFAKNCINTFAWKELESFAIGQWALNSANLDKAKREAVMQRMAVPKFALVCAYSESTLEMPNMKVYTCHDLEISGHFIFF